jgi:hypothetical protein
MPDHKFNEAEEYLLEHWEIAREVEDSMEAVRDKYQVLCERIAEQVKESHKELDTDSVEVYRSSGILKSGGMVLSRKSWPSYGKNQPTGFWIENLRLEFLVDAEEDEPIVGFWLIWSDDADDEFYANAETRIKNAAKKLLTSEKMKAWEFGDNEDTPLVGRQIAPKQELLNMLSKGDSARFVETIVEQLEELAVLIPDIDGILDKKATGGR